MYIKVASIIEILIGLAIGGLGGFMLLILGSSPAFDIAFPALIFGIPTILFSIFLIIFGINLWQLKKWAWSASIVILIIVIVFSIMAIGLSRPVFVSLCVGAIICLISLIFGTRQIFPVRETTKSLQKIQIEEKPQKPIFSKDPLKSVKSAVNKHPKITILIIAILAIAGICYFYEIPQRIFPNQPPESVPSSEVIQPSEPEIISPETIPPGYEISKHKIYGYDMLSSLETPLLTLVVFDDQNENGVMDFNEKGLQNIHLDESWGDMVYLGGSLTSENGIVNFYTFPLYQKITIFLPTASYGKYWGWRTALKEGWPVTTIDKYEFTLTEIPEETKTIYFGLKKVEELTTPVEKPAEEAVPSEPALPPPPTNLSCESEDEQVILNWNNPDISDFSHIHIYRSTDNQQLGDLTYDNVTIESLVDRGLTNSLLYYYTLRTVDTSGRESVNSLVCIGRPYHEISEPPLPEDELPPPEDEPPPPEAVFPTTPALLDPGDSVISGTAFTISWQAVEGVENYVLEQDTSSLFSNPIAIFIPSPAVITNTTRTLSPPPISTLYYYRIKAENSYGSSLWSNIVDIEVNPRGSEVGIILPRSIEICIENCDALPVPVFKVCPIDNPDCSTSHESILEMRLESYPLTTFIICPITDPYLAGYSFSVVGGEKAVSYYRYPNLAKINGAYKVKFLSDSGLKLQYSKEILGMGETLQVNYHFFQDINSQGALYFYKKEDYDLEVTFTELKEAVNLVADSLDNLTGTDHVHYYTYLLPPQIARSIVDDGNFYSGRGQIGINYGLSENPLSVVKEEMAHEYGHAKTDYSVLDDIFTTGSCFDEGNVDAMNVHLGFRDPSVLGPFGLRADDFRESCNQLEKTHDIGRCIYYHLFNESIFSDQFFFNMYHPQQTNYPSFNSCHLNDNIASDSLLVFLSEAAGQDLTSIFRNKIKANCSPTLEEAKTNINYGD